MEAWKDGWVGRRGDEVDGGKNGRVKGEQMMSGRMDGSQRNGEADEGMNVWKERLMSGGWMNERERGG